jgi:hypothetical protein
VVLLMFSGPWLLAPAAAFAAMGLAPVGLAAARQPDLLLVLLAALALALVGIGLQLVLRLWTRRQFQLPLSFWWLMGAGGGRHRAGVGVAHPQRPRLDLEGAAVGLSGGPATGRRRAVAAQVAIGLVSFRHRSHG